MEEYREAFGDEDDAEEDEQEVSERASLLEDSSDEPLLKLKPFQLILTRFIRFALARRSY
tara:strand:- start:175 stop:354 length:180 start_codon:yes stop_codon:yes gene_type:complete